MPTRMLYRHIPTDMCDHWDHKAPSKDTLGPGFWIHTCPKCGWIVTIMVQGDGA